MYSSIVKYSPSKTYQTGMLIELTPGKGFIIMANANVQTAANDQEVSSVQFLTVTAIFVALTYIFTAFINVRLPIAANGGLIHLGNVPLFIGAIIFGKIKVVGYYIAEVVIYGNPLAPVASIPGNLVQIGVAAVITLVVIAPLNVAAKRTGLKK